MIPMPLRIILLLALQFTASPLPAASSWQEADPEQSNTRLGNGKTIQAVVSPNGAYTILLRDEGEQQDFAWKRLYLKQGRSYTLIGVYNTIEGIRWTKTLQTSDLRLQTPWGRIRSKSVKRPTTLGRSFSGGVFFGS